MANVETFKIVDMDTALERMAAITATKEIKTIITYGPNCIFVEILEGQEDGSFQVIGNESFSTIRGPYKTRRIEGGKFNTPIKDAAIDIVEDMGLKIIKTVQTSTYRNRRDGYALTFIFTVSR